MRALIKTFILTAIVSVGSFVTTSAMAFNDGDDFGAPFAHTAVSAFDDAPADSAFAAAPVDTGTDMDADEAAMLAAAAAFADIAPAAGGDADTIIDDLDDVTGFTPLQDTISDERLIGP